MDLGQLAVLLLQAATASHAETLLKWSGEPALLLKPGSEAGPPECWSSGKDAGENDTLTSMIMLIHTVEGDIQKLDPLFAGLPGEGAPRPAQAWKTLGRPRRGLLPQPGL